MKEWMAINTPAIEIGLGECPCCRPEDWVLDRVEVRRKKRFTVIAHLKRDDGAAKSMTWVPTGAKAALENFAYGLEQFKGQRLKKYTRTGSNGYLEFENGVWGDETAAVAYRQQHNL